jgi:hypothetical protein
MNFSEKSRSDSFISFKKRLPGIIVIRISPKICLNRGISKIIDILAIESSKIT